MATRQASHAFWWPTPEEAWRVPPAERWRPVAAHLGDLECGAVFTFAHKRRRFEVLARGARIRVRDLDSGRVRTYSTRHSVFRVAAP